MRHSNAEVAEIRNAVMGALLSTRDGWTTEGLRLATNRVLAALKLVQDRQRRRRKAKP